MVRTVSFLIGGLVAGFAVATWWGGTGEVAVTSGNSAPLTARIEALEHSILVETESRIDLQMELNDLRTELAALRLEVPIPTGDDADASERIEPDERNIIAERVAERFDTARRGRFGQSNEDRIQRFMDAGFSADRAQWIDQRTAELRMEALQAQYDAAREGEPFDRLNAFNTNRALREELGDPQYERYLQAMNRPTSVGVRQVLASSPAEQAGLQPGDQVVAYSGQRVFDMDDLNKLVLEGLPGEPVAVDVLRDGQPIQVYMSRGPIGITGGRLLRRP